MLGRSSRPGGVLLTGGIESTDVGAEMPRRVGNWSAAASRAVDCWRPGPRPCPSRALCAEGNPMPDAKQFRAVVDGKPITFETGKLAGQAGGAVTIRQAATLLPGTATMGRSLREGVDFFPPSVRSEERGGGE